tara:strand:- start:194 stop:343 length:150 start_codon:yes stop_codon:yes gene_type:complete
MGKMKGLITELEEQNNPIKEPSDEELQEIENKVDSMAWEDIEWSEMGHS